MVENIEIAAIPDTFAGRYAGFWARFIGASVDMVIYFPIYYGIKEMCGAEHSILGETIFAIVALVSYAAFFASKYQASPGMCVMRFHVTDENGSRLTYAQAFKWGVVSSVGVAICCVGIFYVEYRFDINALVQLMVSCKEQNLRPEDCMAEVENIINIPFETFSMMMVSSVALALFLMFIWALSVGLAKDKAGFNNLICHTRFLKGRP